MARAAASRRGRERAAALLAVVAVTAGIVLGLRWGARSGGQQAAAVAPGPLSAVPSQPREEEVMVPSSPAEWATVLGTLYERRAAALAEADPAGLAEVYTSGSPQAERDRAEIDQLNAAGRQLRGFEPSVRSVDSIAGEAPLITLLITDDFGPYDVVADGRVVESLPGRDPTRVELILELTAAGWRIDKATRTPESA